MLYDEDIKEEVNHLKQVIQDMKEQQQDSEHKTAEQCIALHIAIKDARDYTQKTLYWTMGLISILSFYLSSLIQA